MDNKNKLICCFDKIIKKNSKERKFNNYFWRGQTMKKWIYIIFTALFFLIFICVYFGLTLGNEIKTSFLANLLSDIAAGILITIFVSVILELFVKDYQKRQGIKELRKFEITRTIEYLQIIDTEVKKIIKQIPDNFLAYSITATPVPPNVDLTTPVWDAIQSSGELPKHISPEFLVNIAGCHSLLNDGKKWIEYIQNNIFNKDVAPQSLDQIATMVTQKLQEVKEIAIIITAQIPNEISRLNSLI